MKRTSIALLAPTLGALTLAASAAAQATDPAAVEAADLLHGGLSRWMEAPLVKLDPGSSHLGEPQAWVRGNHWKAGIAASGFRFVPVVGDAEDASIEMRLAGISLGDAPAFASAREGDVIPTRPQPDRIALPRAGVTEAYTFDLDSIEQTFTFDELPRRGELRVSLEVETSLDAALQDDGSIRFTRGHLAIDYSRAFVVDGTGRKQPILTEWHGNRIDLVVPAEVVASAVLPLTIDPVFDINSLDIGFLDAYDPDLVWNVLESEYVIVFADRVTSTDHDIYAVAVQSLGGVIPGSLQALTMDTVDHRKPRLAVHAPTGSMLAVAEGRTQPGQRRRIYSIPFAHSSTAGAYFTQGPINQPNEAPGLVDCLRPDVSARGGASTDNAFLAVWECDSFAGDQDIKGRFISADGTMGSPTVNLAIDVANSIRPRVSASTGDPSLGSEVHHVVWIEDADDDTRGRVVLRRVNPTTENIGPKLIAYGGTDAVETAVTSTLSAELPFSLSRPCVVAFVVAPGSNPTVDLATWAVPVTLNNRVGLRRSISVMEDARPERFQGEIDIATDGFGFMMVYSERTSVSNRQVFMCSGGVQDRASFQFTVALSERHQAFEATTLDSYVPSIATRFDGGTYTGASADDGACAWQVYDGFTDFELHLGRVDLQNNVPLFGDRPVGAQYCEAAANAGGLSGWISAMAPDQSVSTPLRLVANDLQLFATGYLIVGDVAGYVVGPGGSAGNLCVIGAGRYVNDVGSAGTTGQIITTAFPTNLPQPTGPVSASPGETWLFQYWYRDIQSGLPTSNFTNAVAVHFTN